MKGLKVGDKIIDLEMSRWQRMEVISTVIKLTKDKITVDNKNFPKSYPHNFYLSSLGASWELISK